MSAAVLTAAVKYAAAVAWVRADLGKLLSPEDWRRMIDAAGCKEVCAALSATAYQAAVSNREKSIEDVEKQLRGLQIRRLRQPLAFVRGRAFQLLDCLWRLFEVDNLIALLRGVHHGVAPMHIQDKLVDLGTGSLLDWPSLVNANSVRRVCERLRRSPAGRFYAGALSPALKQYERRHQVFVVEVALLLAYFRRLRRVIDGMRGSDRRAAERFAGTLIDRRNMLWVYRYRIYFRFRPETILSYSLPRGRRLNRHLLHEAAMGAPLDSIVKKVWGSALSDLTSIKDRSEREALLALEMILDRRRYTEASRLMIGYPHHLGVLLAWTVLLQTELKDLITVMEGVDNGWRPPQIRSALIMSGKSP